MAATRRPDPPSFRSNEFAPVIAATALWGIACIVVITQHRNMAAHGQGWWLWVTVCGFALGLWGLFMLRVHHRSVSKAAARQSAVAATTPNAAEPNRPTAG